MYVGVEPEVGLMIFGDRRGRPRVGVVVEGLWEVPHGGFRFWEGEGLEKLGG